MRGRDDKQRRKERQQAQQKPPQKPQRTADERTALDKLISVLAGARNDSAKQQ